MLTDKITDPLERALAHALSSAGIAFTHETEDKGIGLDFRVIQHDEPIYIEVKQFHSERISEQMSRAKEVIAVQGSGAVLFLSMLLTRMGAAEARVAELDGRVLGLLEANNALVERARSAVAAAGWRCFHCGELFHDADAAQDHFGRFECDTPACRVDPNLAAVLRKQEDELWRHRNEQTELGLLYYKLGAEHATALRREEEAGYARGLADGTQLSTTDTGG